MSIKRFSSNAFNRLVYGKYPVTKTQKLIPRTIKVPNYYLTGLVEKVKQQKPSELKGDVHYLEKLTEAGGMAGYMRYFASQLIKKGITPEEIDFSLHEECIKNKFYPGSLDYKGFPKSVSISLNEMACHGIPDTRPLQNDDIIKIDCISYLDGFFGDCCGSFVVGKPSQKNKDLVTVCKKSLEEAIKICGPGVPLNEIGRTIERVARTANLSVVKDYTGHGIGKNLHSLPYIYHFDNDIDQSLMEEGMAFTIEPILTTGNGEVFMWPDDWSIVTKDGEPCAQFEDTVLITSNGTKVLTRFQEIDGKDEFNKDH